MSMMLRITRHMSVIWAAQFEMRFVYKNLLTIYDAVCSHNSVIQVIIRHCFHMDMNMH
jgi:hypothetical protein